MKERWSRISQKLSYIFFTFLEKHPGKLLGGLAGFFFGVLIIIFGFWHTLMLIVLVAIGILIGKRWDEEKQLWRWIDRLFE